MSQPMLTVAGHQADPKKAQLNLLPCRIHHDGNVAPLDSFWSPTTADVLSPDDSTKTAYLRGRKLHGKTVPLPAGYYGAVAEKGDTKREIPREELMDRDAEVQELPDALEIAPLQSRARFDDFVVWGHEALADAGADPYVRGIEEWVSFSEQIHSYPALDSSAK
ncbi:ribonuclease H2 subunit C [Apiospora phragmitis]|uniref:Ribonuclease H2 subunit C n=1 Tax=Apiospora phragmitis TaxID=2905665 RepID=A0ABR1T910_9PEZI